MYLRVVLLASSLALVWAVRDPTSQYHCVQVDRECFYRALAVVGHSGFQRIFREEKEPTCNFGRTYKNCADEFKDCLDYPLISSKIEHVIAQREKLKCD